MSSKKIGLAIIGTGMAAKPHALALNELKDDINEKKTFLLENNYLSSPERLLKFNDLYFDNELGASKRKNIKVINFLKN